MQKPYALFDFDGTLIRGDSIVRFVRFAHERIETFPKCDLFLSGWHVRSPHLQAQGMLLLPYSAVRRW